MTDNYVPATLKQLQFFNLFIHRVYIERVEELLPGITEFKVGIETPEFTPLRSASYIWLDKEGNMVANAVTEKVPRQISRDILDPEYFRDYDFPIKVRLFPNWEEPANYRRKEAMIEEVFPEGRMYLPPGFPGGAVQFVREWIKEQVDDRAGSEAVST